MQRTDHHRPERPASNEPGPCQTEAVHNPPPERPLSPADIADEERGADWVDVNE